MTTTTKRIKELERIKELIELEKTRGEIVPGGAQGGVVARARRGGLQNAGLRARQRLRYLFQARSMSEVKENKATK